MRHAAGASRTFAVGALAAMLALIGCGGSGSDSHPPTSATSGTTTTSSPTSAATEQPRQKPPMRLSISAIPDGGEGHPSIPARYTCDGADISPALQWSNVPPGTRELVLLIAHLSTAEVHFDWSVAGLVPTLDGLTAGGLPPGAIVGRNSRGQTAYSICPAKDVRQSYGAILFAMPRHIDLRSGFQTRALANRANREAIGEAQFGFSYERR